VTVSIGIFAKGFLDLQNINVVGADKYFHCKSNAQAAQLGLIGYTMSVILSDVKEALDQGRMFVGGGGDGYDEKDQEANWFGRTQGSVRPYIPPSQVCLPFRVPGIPPQF